MGLLGLESGALERQGANSAEELSFGLAVQDS